MSTSAAESGKSRRNPIAVYTAIFGGKDTPVSSPHEEGVDRLCFTDDHSVKSAHFEVIRAAARDPVRSARHFKILPQFHFPRYRNTIWVDGNIEFTTPRLKNLLDRFLSDADLAVFRHPWRNCIYEEAEACIALNKDDSRVIRLQVQRYREEGYPANNGLVASGVLLRRHGARALEEFSEAWWQEVSGNSARDQLSFNYVAWRLGFKYRIIDEDIFANDWAVVKPHLK